jgi:hypothetical protein
MQLTRRFYELGLTASQDLVADGTDRFYASSWWQGADSLLEAQEVADKHPTAIAWHFGLSTKHSGGSCNADAALAAQLHISGWYSEPPAPPPPPEQAVLL